MKSIYYNIYKNSSSHYRSTHPHEVTFFKRLFHSHFPQFSSQFLIPVAGDFHVILEWKGKEIKETNNTYIIRGPDLDSIPENQSRLECIGPYYQHRWCKAKNICFNAEKKSFIWFGLHDVDYYFNRSLMTPGSRPIPSDYPSCRLIFRFHKKAQGNFQFPIPNSTYVKDGLSYLTCRWYSMQLLWHALYDYTLPLYWMMHLTGGPNRTRDHVFLMDENTNKFKGMQLIHPLSADPVINLRFEPEWNSSCFKDVIVGVPKSEKEFIEGKYSSGIDMPYQYPPVAFEGFREHMLNYYISNYSGICNTNDNQINHRENHGEKENENKKRILFLWRASPKRHIDNRKELFEAVKEWCGDNCIVESSFLENMTIAEQLAFICNASLLIANHGGGLSHMTWIQHPGAIIEIFPYKYTCRNWYKEVADGLGIGHFSWFNPYRNKTRQLNPNSCFQECINDNNSCLTNPCHEILRDQITTVDLDSFKEIFLKAWIYINNVS